MAERKERPHLLAFYRAEKGEEEFCIDGISVGGWSGLKRKCEDVFNGRGVNNRDIGIVCCGMATLPVSSVGRLKEYLIAELNHVHKPMKLGYDGKDFSFHEAVGVNGSGELVWSEEGELYTKQEALAILSIVNKVDLRIDLIAAQELAYTEQK